MKTVYVVVNEASLVYATTDGDRAAFKCQQMMDEAISEEIEESGREEEDLTDDEYAEYAFSNAYNGGYYYYEEVSFNEDDDTVMTSKGDELVCSEILSMSAANDLDIDMDDIDFDELDDYDLDELEDSEPIDQYSDYGYDGNL